MKRFWFSAIAACGMCILGAISAGAEDSTEVPVETQISTIYIEDLETSTETTETTLQQLFLKNRQKLQQKRHTLT